MIAAERFFVEESGPLRQGDILLAGVSRLVAEDRFSPAAWDQLDAYDVTIPRDGEPDLLLAAGPALIMVTSHDCHFDKEWNLRCRELIRAGVAQAEAERRAEADPSLDRTFTASPLISAADVDRDQGALRAGKILGYLPVPASGDGLVPEAVVDLTYRVTLDRLDVVRVTSVSNEVRMHLRYGLAQLDSLRASAVGFELERVIGRQITRVSLPPHNRLLVRLHLDDDTVVELVQLPAEPDQSAPGRTTAPEDPRQADA